MGIGVKLAMATMPTSDKTTLETEILITDELNSIDNKHLLEQDLHKVSKKNSRCRRRASLDVLKECDTIEETVKWSALRRRRTSLPTILASSKKKTSMSSVLVDTGTLVELHFLVDELNRNPSNVTALALRLKELLNPYNKVVWLPKSLDTQNEEPIRVSPRHLPSKRTVQRRFDGQGGLFSTTTTATGLPKEEPGPVKAKRLPKIVKDKSTPIGTPLHSRCSSPVDSRPASYHMNRRQTFPNISLSQTQKLTFSFQHHSVPKKISAISSDYESDEPSPMVISPHSPLSRSRSVNERCDSNNYPLDSIPPSLTINNQEFYPPRNVITPPPDEDLTDHETAPTPYSRRGSQLTDEGVVYFENYQNEILENIYDWNFPIFALAESTECVLSQTAFKLFQSTGLFDAFQIPKNKFVRYMRALENGYREIPYHNKIHAADVLHGCWFLSTQEIPGFHEHFSLSSSDSSDSDSGTCTVSPRQVNNIGHGSLAQAIPALELLSLYLAAAMHDYDHPGKTNAFLVETRHPLATFYNDRSVLENHHASASWGLLYSDKNFDFLEHLDTAEWKRLRFLIVEAILATDLKKHFEILSQFSTKTQSCSTPIEDGVCDSSRRNGINWSADKDRLLVCQMVIKLADIGGPAKSKPLHVTWTKAICEEFFKQGDEERRLSVPVSPFMDRSKPQVAELQRTFINNLITPIVFSMHKSGILAGEVPKEHDLYCNQGQSAEQNLLVEQLKSNLNFWKTKTPHTGHNEMMEAFKLALPQRFSFSNFAQSEERKESTPSSERNHSANDADGGANTTSSSKPEDDEVFDAIRTNPPREDRLLKCADR